MLLEKEIRNRSWKVLAENQTAKWKFENVCVEFFLRKQKENKKQNPKMETGKVNGYVACSR